MRLLRCPLRRPAAAHLRAFATERGVRERLERLVEERELVRDPEQPLVLVEPRVQPVHLLAEAIEPLEERVQLPVVYVLALGQRRQILARASAPPGVSLPCSRGATSRARPRRRRKRATPATTPTVSSAQSSGAPTRPTTNVWWSSSLAA